MSKTVLVKFVSVAANLLHTRTISILGKLFVWQQVLSQVGYVSLMVLHQRSATFGYTSGIR